MRRLPNRLACLILLLLPLPAAAAQFPLRHKAVTSIVIGARTPEEVAQNAAYLATPIPDELWAAL